jgi:hypothetical protein
MPVFSFQGTRGILTYARPEEAPCARARSPFKDLGPFLNCAPIIHPPPLVCPEPKCTNNSKILISKLCSLHKKSGSSFQVYQPIPVDKLLPSSCTIGARKLCANFRIRQSTRIFTSCFVQSA